jgi:hypothetical protein
VLDWLFATSYGLGRRQEWSAELGVGTGTRDGEVILNEVEGPFC